MKTTHTFRIFLVLFLLVVSSFAFSAIPKIGPEEIKWGDKAALQAEKDNKVLDDKALIARVKAIGEPIAAAANTAEVAASYGTSTITQFPYNFKIIDSDDVNAFSVTGGHIYVYRGLINVCQSDHELAAVIAHEIAHASHHHMVHMMREQSKLEGRMALVMLAGILGDVNPRDLSNVITGAQFYKIAKLSGYGQLAEQDADATAVSYMKSAGYNPVGVLTFLERIAERPEVIDWGIMQTHPRSEDRVKAVKTQLEACGIPINRRAVTTWSTAKVVCGSSEKVEYYDVMISDRTVCRMADKSRAYDAAGKINALLDQGLQIHEMRVVGNTLHARGEPVLSICELDLSVSKQTASSAAAQAAAAVRSVLLRDIVNDIR